MMGRYSAIASLVGVRSVSALALLAGVGGVFAVSRALERRQAVDSAPSVVPPSQLAVPAVIFDPFVVGPGAPAERSAQSSTSGSRLGRSVVRVLPPASLQLPVVVLP